LCIDGGYEICAEMYNKNILAPLATFIPKVRRCVMFPKHHASRTKLSICLLALGSFG
jgi:hypothetical protein